MCMWFGFDPAVNFCHFCNLLTLLFFAGATSTSPKFDLYFRIWSSAKPRPIKDVSSQSLGPDLVNINVYAKVYQSIPLSSRDRAIFTFSEFGTRQSLDR